LSASEVAALELDADWVILSACNTAAGGARGAESLSGLARAFIYAGTRALLVSHWAVDSTATVKLVTTIASVVIPRREVDPVPVGEERMRGFFSHLAVRSLARSRKKARLPRAPR
jgi:hypothetical protein